MLLFFFGMGIAAFSDAQSLTNSVIASQGESARAGKIDLSWTLGELAIETNFTENGMLTEGFHQPERTEDDLSNRQNSEDTGNTPSATTEIALFPNPTASVVSIILKSDLDQPLNARLMDIQGQVIYRTTFLPNEIGQELNLGNFPDGIYFLELISQDGLFRSNHKISKIN